jgi:hypothetical protein
MFNSKQQPLMFFGGVAKAPEFMYLPNGIAIDSKNTIYVSDYGKNHVNVYELINTGAKDSEGPALVEPPAPADTPSQSPAAPPPSAPPPSPAPPAADAPAR